jgi:hypothetical protein
MSIPSKMPVVSLCIPRVSNTVTESQVYDIFHQLCLGFIHKIDVRTSTANAHTQSNLHKNPKGETFKCIFIHFNKWFDNENASYVLKRLQNGQEIKIIYDDPWFWKVSLYRKKPLLQKPMVDSWSSRESIKAK